MKREKGITLVALIITIVVMLILASVSVSIGTNSLDSMRLKGFYTQLEIIQKRVDDIATTNESYINSDGNTVYLKEQGVAYADLTDAQKTLLQSIINLENLVGADATKFRYFTKDDLEQYLDLSDMDYNVFIDFDNRIIIAEDGIKIGDKTYHALENATYFVHQNKEKNKGTIEALKYTVTLYGTDKYKVVIAPSNIVGDVGGTGYVKYKKTTTKYWEVADNTEIIIEADVEYNIVYVDANKNSIEKTIKVEVDSGTGVATVTEIEI